MQPKARQAFEGRKTLKITQTVPVGALWTKARVEPFMKGEDHDECVWDVQVRHEKALDLHYASPHVEEEDKNDKSGDDKCDEWSQVDNSETFRQIMPR